MNILQVLPSAAKEAEAKQETATRELQAITAAIRGIECPQPRDGESR